MSTFIPSAIREAHDSVRGTVLLELDQTVQAYYDNGNDGTAADFAADIVRVLTRTYLGGEE